MPVKVVRRARKELWALRAVALVIAIVLWVSVMGGRNHEITKKVTLEYQLPPTLVLANQPPEEVTIRVSGPKAFLKELEAKNLSRSIPLMTAKVGEYAVTLDEQVLDLPLGVRILSRSQDSVTVKLDRAVQKRVPIRASLPTSLPEGYRILSVTLKPSTVEVRGAQAQEARRGLRVDARVAALESIPTEAIQLASAALNQSINVKLNTAGLPGIRVDDGDKNVVVEVQLAGSTTKRWMKNLKLAVHVGNDTQTKAIDAESLGIRVRPAMINLLVEGPSNVVDHLKNDVIEVWATLPQIKAGTYHPRVDWKIPPEIRVLKRSTDLVDVQVPAIK